MQHFVDGQLLAAFRKAHHDQIRAEFAGQGRKVAERAEAGPPRKTRTALTVINIPKIAHADFRMVLEMFGNFLADFRSTQEKDAV